MKTLYIDVYFLINFTVDYLSIFFACFILNLKTTPFRLIISSCAAAGFACLVALVNLVAPIYITVLVLCAIIICVITPKILNFAVAVKLFIGFLLFETLFGGIVSMIFSLLEKHLSPYLTGFSGGGENSKILFLVCILLLAYGVLHLALIILGKTDKTKRCDLIIKILELEICIIALVDSGNILCDPMTGRPVIIIKRRALFGLYEKYGENALFDRTSPLACRMRLIPVKSIVGERLLYGIRPDEVKIRFCKRLISVDAVIAIDEETGTFDNSEALLPSALLI